MILLALILWLWGRTNAAPAEPSVAVVQVVREESLRPSLDEILDAIRAVETGGLADGGRDALGDGGRALGPFQIHRAYFADSKVAGHYEDCRDPQFARRVVVAYWQRWCPDALVHRDAQVLARVHNGGPSGARKSATASYWHKVELQLTEFASQRAVALASQSTVAR